MSKLCHLPVLLALLEPKRIVQYVTLLPRSSKINNRIPSSLKTNFSSLFFFPKQPHNSHFLSHQVSAITKPTENEIVLRCRCEGRGWIWKGFRVCSSPGCDSGTPQKESGSLQAPALSAGPFPCWGSSFAPAGTESQL